MSVNVGSAIAYLDLDMSGFTSGISQARSALSDFISSTDSLSSRFQNLGSSISNVGAGMSKSLTLPIVGVGAAATKMAGDFEASMSKVEAISGATSEEMDQLREKAIEMGAETKFSAKESADAFTYMAMAGWDASQMVDGISGIMSLAAADGLDLATTSDIVTDALTAFGLQASDSAHFADVLAQASSSANTNVSMLGESFKYVAPVAGSLGMSVEDVSLALGLMANSGIKGSQAGTTLRASLTNLVKPTDEMTLKMEELDIQVQNSDGTMKSLREIMDILRNRFSSLTEAEKSNAAATLFGKEAMSGMLTIINASEEDYLKLATAIDGATGRADEMADTMMNNLSGSIEELKGAVETLMIRLGDALIPVIKSITELLIVVAEKIGNLTEEQIQQIVQIAALVAAIGPVLIIVGKVISIIGTVISVGGKLFAGIQAIVTFIGSVLIPAISAIGAPVLVVIAVITALIAAGVALYKNWDEVSAWAKKAWESIKSTINSAGEAIGGFFSELGESLSKQINKIMDWLKSLVSSVKDFLMESFKNISRMFTDILPTMIEVGKGIIRNLWDGMRNMFSSVASWVTDALSNLFRPVTDMVGRIVNPIKSAFGSVGSWISGSFANGLDYVPYNGFVAELHQGERVLTKEENKEYTQGGHQASSGDTYIFNSPKAIDEYEAARLMKQTKRELDMDI